MNVNVAGGRVAAMLLPFVMLAGCATAPLQTSSQSQVYSGGPATPPATVTQPVYGSPQQVTPRPAAPTYYRPVETNTAAAALLRDASVALSRNDFTRAVSAAEQRFLTWLARAKDNITIDGEAEILDRIERDGREIDVPLADVAVRDRFVVRAGEAVPVDGTIVDGVSSVDESAAKVEKLGGTICKPKTAVPQMGYFAICRDTEGNEFALWEANEGAK